jgi:hypothetical protein
MTGFGGGGSALTDLADGKRVKVRLSTWLGNPDPIRRDS